MRQGQDHLAGHSPLAVRKPDLLAGTAPFNIVRAQGAALKVGVLLPRSGAQAGIGRDYQRGVDIAGPIFKVAGPSLTCRS